MYKFKFISMSLYKQVYYTSIKIATAAYNKYILCNVITREYILSDELTV